MAYSEYLGMELDIVLDQLHSNNKEVEVQYTVAPRSAFRGIARILKVHSADDKLILTASYQTSREGGVR
jgi:hypothetical protein